MKIIIIKIKYHGDMNIEGINEDILISKCKLTCCNWDNLDRNVNRETIKYPQNKCSSNLISKSND